MCSSGSPGGAWSNERQPASTELFDTDRIIAAGEKPRRWGSWYVAEHRIRAMRAYLQTIISTSIGNPLIYLFAMGIGLATIVDQGSGAAALGVTYLAFIAPALIATAAVQVAAEECTYPLMMGFKWNPIFFAMNAAPISGNQIVNGLVISVLARMVPTVVIYFIVTVPFGAILSWWGVLIIPISALTGLAVGCAIMPYTARIEEDKGQMAMIQRFGILPMFLFSGTFFPLERLPWYLQWIGWISPLWHGTQLGRVASYGLEEPAFVTVIHIAYLLAIVVVGWRWTQRIVTRRLDK